MSEQTNLMENSEETIAEQAKALNCSACGAEVAEGQKYCAACGKEISVPEVQEPCVCGHCGAQLQETDQFCTHCGNRTAVAPKAEEETVKQAASQKKPKKKKLLPVLVAAGLTVVTVIIIVLSIAFRETPVESVRLSETAIKLYEEDTQNISCDVYPDNATDKNVRWKSSDKGVAVVDDYGRITAVGAGECTVTATAGDESAKIAVTVKKKRPDFEALYNGLSDNYGWTLGSDGSFLSADTNVLNLDDYSRMSILYAIEDMNKKIGLPDSLYNDMLKTTWSMGKQQESFEDIGVKVTWTYHPDKGLEVTYKLIDN
ncbi:MAG: Ig-like domain-containing protein [Oscillospiraceae bacterium]|nr:Ig-like domain-containing protein [Oscillospiraceae bacterium]